MAWRSQGITGSNNIPLGPRRRIGGDEDDSASPAPAPSDGLKRGRSPTRPNEMDDAFNAALNGAPRRKKRNRWGDANENKAAGLMGLPTAIMANMTSEQLEAYTLNLRIEEISQKLRINDVVPAEGDRSPSPPPQYDNFGRRVNTREYRYRKRLEDERHKLVEKAMKTIPNYHPPAEYKRPTKTQEKVYVPVNDYPEINFIGLLIGPRGNTLKKMESESGAKIAIRGKGSVKEGKGRSDAAHTSNQEEDLHCLIMADTEEKVNKAKEAIARVIETESHPHRPLPHWLQKLLLTSSQAASIPEGQNELKRNQLRELAALNGTLRDDENQACQNCGEIGHRKYDCPNQKNYTAGIICRVCGNAGHMARDCPDRVRGQDWRNNDRGGFGGPGGRPAAGRIAGGDAADKEYEALMNELGGGSGAPGLLEAGPGGYDSVPAGPGGGQAPWKTGGATGGVAPWKTGGATGGPAPWQSGGATGGPAPWHSGGGRHDERDGGDRPWARGGRGGGYGGGRDRDNYGGGYNQGGSGGAAPWQQNSYGGGGYGGNDRGGYGGGYGGGAGQYDQGGYGYGQGSGGAPWNQGGNQYGAPPPPPSDNLPPPPPSGAAPPPPPPGM